MHKLMLLVLAVAAVALVSCKKDSNGPTSNPPPAATSAIDISHTGTQGGTFGLKGVDQVKRYETFVADSTYLHITGIDVKIRKWDSTQTYHNVTVTLYKVGTNGQPSDSLAAAVIDVSTLKARFVVLSSSITYRPLIAGNVYAIALGQAAVETTTNNGFEWCTKAVTGNYHFGKYSGTSWTGEDSFGDGWLIVHLDNAN